MDSSVTAMKYGWYGASCVKLPIQAPPMPRLKRTTGRMQQDDAASAPMIPPAAASFGPLLREEPSTRSLNARTPLVFGALLIIVLPYSRLSFYVHALIYFL